MRSFVTDALFAAASIALTAGAVVVSAPAAAATTDGAPRQTMVRVDDLNLSAPAGRATADQRIRVAANAVCSTGDMRFPVDGACRDKAISDATVSLGSRPGDDGASR